MNKIVYHPISIAPMMDYTDRHFRYLFRLISTKVLLYSEMITAKAIIHGDRNYILGHSQIEHPLVLQLGGDNPLELAECAKIGQDYGYSEINLNVGCPSDRVKDGNFGACLMKTPDIVHKCIEAMKKAVSIPVTLKHRIGLDSMDKYEDLYNFVKQIENSGCDRFIVHARIAILKGLSPEQNRKIPPLRYHDVYRLKEEFPHLHIEINGGIKTFDEVDQHLSKVNGVMIGRAAYDHLYMFMEADSRYYNQEYIKKSRKQILLEYIPYINNYLKSSPKAKAIHAMKHTVNMFNNYPNSKLFKRVLSENMYKPDTKGELLLKAIEFVEEI